MAKRMTRFVIVFMGVLMVATMATESVGGPLARQAPGDDPDIGMFFQTLALDEEAADAALELIEVAWKDSYAALLWDLVRFIRRPGNPADPSALARQRLTRFLEQQTGQRFGDDLDRWHQWIWELPYETHPDYSEFKGVVYGVVDPQMRDFFPPGVKSLIRLDKVIGVACRSTAFLRSSTRNRFPRMRLTTWKTTTSFLALR